MTSLAGDWFNMNVGFSNSKGGSEGMLMMTQLHRIPCDILAVKGARQLMLHNVLW